MLPSIIRKYTTSLLGAITDPDSLTVYMWCENLITDFDRNKLQTTKGLSNFEKTNTLLMSLYNSCKTGVISTDLMQTFCTILKKQGNSVLDTIADNIIDELNTADLTIGMANENCLLLLAVVNEL